MGRTKAIEPKTESLEIRPKNYNTLDSEEMKSLFKEHDISLFTETWSSNIYNYDVTIFQHFIENRKGKGPKEREWRNNGLYT